MKKNERTSKWTEEIAADARDMYINQGKSIRDIAFRFKLSYAMVHQHLTLDGIDFRPRGGAQPIPQDTVQKILVMYHKGESVGSIMRETKLGLRTVKRALRESGVKAYD